MADKIQIELEITGNGEAKISKLKGAVEDLGSNGSKSLGNLTSAFDVFIGSLGAGVTMKAFEMVTDAAKQLFDTFVVDGVKAAQQQEDAVAKLTAALTASGQASQEAVGGFIAFATEVQKNTKYTDDAVIEAGALIATIGQLGADELPKATQAAIDLSAALGMDLQSAAALVGKAAEGNISTLKRYGIEVRQGANDAETFANALEQINGKFGGAAAAQAGTFSGQIERLKNKFGEVQETIGNTIIQNKAFVNVLAVVGQAFDNLLAVVEDNKQNIADFFSATLLVGIDIMKGVIAATAAVQASVLALAKAFVGAQLIVSEFTDVLTLGMTDAGERAKASAAKIVELDAAIQAVGGSDTILGQLNETLANMGQAAEAGVGRTVSGLEALPETVANTRQAVLEINEEYDLAELDRESLLQDARTAQFDKVLQDTISENEMLAAMDKDANAQKIADNKFTIDTILQNKLASDRASLAATKKLKDDEIRLEQMKVRAVTGALGDLATFQNAKTKELQVVGKAAAIAQATVNTYQAANLALATIPPPFGFIAAAANVAAGLLNVSNIAGVGLATGITEVPAGYNNDTFPARLSSGERVVDRGTNEDLKGFLNGGGPMVSLLQGILNRLGSLENTFVVNISGREIVNEVREGLRSGRELAYG